MSEVVLEGTETISPAVLSGNLLRIRGGGDLFWTVLQGITDMFMSWQRVHVLAFCWPLKEFIPGRVLLKPLCSNMFLSSKVQCRHWRGQVRRKTVLICLCLGLVIFWIQINIIPRVQSFHFSSSFFLFFLFIYFLVLGSAHWSTIFCLMEKCSTMDKNA